MTLTTDQMTRPLYPSPAAHRDALAESFAAAFKAKYDKGQDEHGGFLFEKNVSTFAEEEVLDFWAYVKTANEQRAAAIKLLEDWCYLTRVNIEHPVYQALLSLRGTRKDVA